MEEIKLEGDWANQRWRLSNIYYIQDEHGKVVQFKPNPQQLDLLDDLWWLNIILKSRQHGFTTLIDLLGLDTAVWTPNQNIGIIAHGLREAQEIFRTKVQFPYSRLPEPIKAAAAPKTETKTEYEFANGSRIAVGTSMRSGTYQLLHVSEFGKISRRYPDKAKEIVAGSFNAVHQGQHIFVESTAEGRDGWFYDMVQLAKKKRSSGVKLTPLDFRLHFFPWWRDQRNKLDPTDVAVPEKLQKYFEELQRDHGIELTAAQKAWYVKKIETAADLMYAEHPSTVDEAFKAAVEGAIYGKEIALLYERKLIGKVEHIPGVPVNTYWDFGRNDANAIWFEQFVAGRHRFIRYYENRMRGPSHYMQKLQEFQMEGGWVYGRHFLPHDAETITLASSENKDGRNMRELLIGLGMPESSIVIVSRIDDLNVGINMTRAVLPLCEFDQERCDEGLEALEQYQYEWDEKIGDFRNHPRKDWSSHGADALRQFGQGHHLAGAGSYKRTNRRSGMAV